MRRFLLTLTLISFSGWSQPAQRQTQPPIVVRFVETPPTPHRDWIDGLEAFGPLIAAAVALIIGITQWRLQRQQVKQDLFEKRYRIYQATHAFVAEASKYGSRTDPETDNTFANGTAHAEFLFGQDVLEFIGLIRSTAKSLADVDRNLANVCIADEDKAANSQFQDQLMAAMNQNLRQMNDVFRPYLRI